MEKEIIRRWEVNKKHLRSYIKTLRYGDCNEYKKLVRILITECLNYGNIPSHHKFDADEISCVFHDGYSGVEIYLFHVAEYQPTLWDYYIFDQSYGSCSGCDTLLGILGGGGDCDAPITDKQADELMTLMLHMVQRMKCLGDLLED